VSADFTLWKAWRTISGTFFSAHGQCRMNRRNFLAAAGALTLAGCAAPAPRGVYETTEIPAPGYRVGDTWTYRRRDAYNGLPRGMLTRSVTAMDDRGIHISTRNEHGNIIDDAIFQAPGLQLAGTFSEDGPMIGRCDPPYRRYDFPLVAGKRWRQDFYLHRTDLGGTRNYVDTSMYAEGWEDIAVGDRSYHALILRRQLNLGQKSFFEGDMYRYETEWYAPAVRSFVRWHTREEFYRLGGGRRGGGLTLENGDRFIYELESYQPG
jgi:hypothetical protein